MITAATAGLLGLPLNTQTLAASAIAATVVVGFGLWTRFRTTSASPGRMQLAWESVIETLDRRLETATGRPGGAAVPLVISLFLFILVANSLRVIPATSGWLPTATADLDLTVALALIVFVVVHVAAIRSRGVKGYLRHLCQPYWWLAPLNLLSEMIRPVTMALRLFGTGFAGGLILALIGELIPPAVAPIPHAIWSLFDLAIGILQAVIFSLLALLYYESAVDHRATPLHHPPIHPDSFELVAASSGKSNANDHQL